MGNDISLDQITSGELLDKVQGLGAKPVLLIQYREDDHKTFGMSNIAIRNAEKFARVVSCHEVMAGDNAMRESITGALLTYPTIEYITQMLQGLSKLKVVVMVNMDENIDPQIFHKHGVRVAMVSGAISTASADFAFTLMLVIARKLNQALIPNGAAPGHGTELAETTLGIVGMGGIGTEIAKRAKAFRQKVVYHHGEKREDHDDAEFHETLQAMLPRCDFVIIACRADESIKGLFGDNEFGRMKETAYLINISSGKLINTASLTRAITSKQIAGAALDKTDPDPLPEDHALRKLPNVMITPSMCTATTQAKANIETQMLQNMLAGLAGNKMPCEICF